MSLHGLLWHDCRQTAWIMHLGITERREFSVCWINNFIKRLRAKWKWTVRFCSLSTSHEITARPLKIVADGKGKSKCQGCKESHTHTHVHGYFYSTLASSRTSLSLKHNSAVQLAFNISQHGVSKILELEFLYTIVYNEKNPKQILLEWKNHIHFIYDHYHMNNEGLFLHVVSWTCERKSTPDIMKKKMWLHVAKNWRVHLVAQSEKYHNFFLIV